jgi:hypothetical protein
MKFHINDKVVFLKRSNKEDAWPLINYEEYTIINAAFETFESGNIFYGVKDKNDQESTWYHEDDFLTLKEHRKLKLKKLKSC